tara:strand:- start:1298 stop:1495 length:198 start_codon:yes stop_codon:yes gene_type:complete
MTTIKLTEEEKKLLVSILNNDMEERGYGENDLDSIHKKNIGMICSMLTKIGVNESNYPIAFNLYK